MTYVTLASVISSSLGLPPTPSSDHILFFTSPGSPAFTGSNLTIVCSLRAIKLSFVTFFTVKFYIFLCGLPTCKLKIGRRHARFSHHHMCCTWTESWGSITILLKNEWLNNWKWVNLKPETTDHRGCLSCLAHYFIFGSFSFLLIKPQIYFRSLRRVISIYLIWGLFLVFILQLTLSL